MRRGTWERIRLAIHGNRRQNLPPLWDCEPGGRPPLQAMQRPAGRRRGPELREVPPSHRAGGALLPQLRGASATAVPSMRNRDPVGSSFLSQMRGPGTTY